MAKGLAHNDKFIGRPRRSDKTVDMAGDWYRLEHRHRIVGYMRVVETVATYYDPDFDDRHEAFHVRGTRTPIDHDDKYRLTQPPAFLVKG